MGPAGAVSGRGGQHSTRHQSHHFRLERVAFQLHILPNCDHQRFCAASGSTVAPMAPFGSVKIPPRIKDLKTGMTKIKVRML